MYGTKKIFLLLIFNVSISLNLFCEPSKKLLVDNFDTGKNINSLGGDTGVWISNEKDKMLGCEIHFDSSTRVGNSGFSLCINYRITPEEFSFAPSSPLIEDIDRARNYPAVVYWSKLKGVFSEYKYLTMYLKGDKKNGFTRSLALEVIKIKEGVWKIARYNIYGITDKWEKFVIPLRVFKEIDDWADLEQIGFVFDKNVTRKSGAIYIDDIFFVTDSKEERSVFRDKDVTEFVSQRFDMYKGEGDLIINKIVRYKDYLPLLLTAENFLEFGKIKGKNDLSAKIYSWWDDEWINFYAVIKDNKIIATKQGPEIEQEDCLSLYFDFDNNGYVFGGKNDFQINISPNNNVWDATHNLEPSFSDFRVIMTKTWGKYYIKCAIKWKYFNVVPEKNKIIGFSVAVQDVDSKNSIIKGKLNWKYEVVPGKINLGGMILK